MNIFCKYLVNDSCDTQILSFYDIQIMYVGVLDTIQHKSMKFHMHMSNLESKV